MNQTLQTDCRFCSTVSKANGQDPIGSAGTYHHWLIAEIPQPWPRGFFLENPLLHPIIEMIKALRAQNIWVRPLVIAPEQADSHPDATRILYYRRPAPLFAHFEKQEYLLPTERVGSLATALLTQPENLSQFEPYRQETLHIRDLIVCTHGNVDVACSRFGYPIYKQLRQDYAGQELRIWRCSHFGGHNFAPTLIDLPTGQYWGHLEPKILDSLVFRRGDVANLRRFYRGWSGLARFEQMVEREIWMQHGWDWLTYRKAGQTLTIDTTQEDEYDADWAEVRIDFETPDDRDAGAYKARVEVCGEVMTQWKSGEEHPREPVKQYQVTQLRRVA